MSRKPCKQFHHGKGVKKLRFSTNLFMIENYNLIKTLDTFTTKHNLGVQNEGNNKQRKTQIFASSMRFFAVLQYSFFNGDFPIDLVLGDTEHLYNVFNIQNTS